MIDGFWYGLALGAFLGVGLMMTLFRWGVKRIRKEYEDHVGRMIDDVAKASAITPTPSTWPKWSATANRQHLSSLLRQLEEKLNPPITVTIGRGDHSVARPGWSIHHMDTASHWFRLLAVVLWTKHRGNVEIHEADLLDLPDDLSIDEYRDHDTNMHVLALHHPADYPNADGQDRDFRVVPRGDEPFDPDAFLEVGTTNGEPHQADYFEMHPDRLWDLSRSAPVGHDGLAAPGGEANEGGP